MYEAAYVKAIQLCEECHDVDHKLILEEICVGLRKELQSHVEKASELKESESKKATRDYTALVRKAYEGNSLSEIAAAICPCNKLFMLTLDFI